MMTPTPAGGPRSQWRILGQDLLAAKVTLAIVAALIVVQGLVELSGGAGGNPGLYRSLGLSRQGLLGGGLWEIFSYPWIHGNWWHLGVNLVALLATGPRVERIGGGRLLLLLLGLGCFGGGLSYLLLGGGEGTTLLVGASGGILALLLWLTGVSPGSRMWPLSISGRNLGLGLLMASAILTLLNPELGVPVLSQVGHRLGNISAMEISHACHLGGALVGWGAARWALRPRVSLAQLQRDRARRQH